ncbi:MAG: hypothetical protein JKY56_02550 [Kofleriaceae bacterium]|nr:hypothetical protein [Kofleriaceae bacterium]
MPIEFSQPALALGITSRALRGVFLLTLGAILSLGCAASDAEIRRARHSGYNAAFATVYSEALAAVARRYPRSVEDPTTGMIKTAWHIVSVQTGTSASNSPRAGTQARGSGRQTSGGVDAISPTAASNNKRYFIRFRVQVIGGDPWRVRVFGEASEWSAGDVPLPLRGAEVPPWVEGRTAALEVDIYRRLKKYAVLIEENKKVKPVFKIARPDSFGEIPDEASSVVEAVYLAVKSRDMGALRTHLSEDVVWSPGSAGNAELAMVMWQADTGLLDAMSTVLDEGCTAESDSRIRCDTAKQSGMAAHVIFEKRAPGWVLSEFLREEALP